MFIYFKNSFIFFFKAGLLEIEMVFSACLTISKEVTELSYYLVSLHSIMILLYGVQL